MLKASARNMLRRFVEEDTALRAYVLAVTGSTCDTDDIVQNVWRILWEKIDVYDESRSLRAWAMGVARLEVLKWRQKLARRREVLSDRTLELLESSALELAPELDRRAELLEECLEMAPGDWRDLLVQKYFDGLSISRIAERMSRSVAAVEMALVRARRALKECVERKLQDAAVEGQVNP